MSDVSKRLVLRGLVNASATTLYTTAIATLMFLGDHSGQQMSVLVPIALLMLYVVSAAVVGSLIFGRPVMLYLEGKKQEAVQLLVATIAWLTLITALALFLVLT